LAVTGTGRVWVSWWDKTQLTAMAAYRDPGQRRYTGVTTLGSKNSDMEDGAQVRLSADPRPNATGVIAIWPSMLGSKVSALPAYTTGSAWYGDCGSTDSSPCVASPSTTDIAEPAISWGSDGRLLIGFYELSSTGRTYGAGRSQGLNQVFNYGAMATKPTTTGTSELSPFGRLGDYTSVAEAADGSIYATWSDTRNGAQQLWGAS
jgi:hypothetical protein